MTKPGLIRFLGLGALLLSACTSAPSETVQSTDGGGSTYRITCGGTFSSPSDCFERAGFLCGNRGYSVVKEIDIAPPEGSLFFAPSAHEATIRCNSGGSMGMGEMNGGGMNGPAGSMGGVSTH